MRPSFNPFRKEGAGAGKRVESSKNFALSQSAMEFEHALSQNALRYQRQLNEIPSMAPPKDEEMEEGPAGKVSFEVPSDWCLKDRVVFQVEESTEWCSFLGGLQMPQAKEMNFGTVQDMEDKKKHYFEQACFQFQYPEEKRDRRFMLDINTLCQQTKSSLHSSEQSRLDAFKRRRNKWQLAFRSLYMGVRKGQLPYFYIVVENRSKYTVLFFHVDKKPYALLCNATTALRSKLSRSNCTFSTPLVHVRNDPAEGESDDEDSDEDKDDDEFWTEVKITKTHQENQKYSSLLCFEGRTEVHHLYDFISNTFAKLNTIKGDLPVLLSHKPFLHSVSKPITITKNNRYLTSKKDTVYIIEFQGPILPNTLINLCHIFSEVGGNFVCKISPHKNSCGLNCFKSISELKDTLHPYKHLSLCLEPEVVRKRPFACTEIKYLKDKEQYTSQLEKIQKSDLLLRSLKN